MNSLKFFVILVMLIDRKVLSKEYFCKATRLENGVQCSIMDYAAPDDPNLVIKVQAPSEMLVTALLVHGEGGGFQHIKSIHHNFTNLKEITFRSINLEAIESGIFSGFNLSTCDFRKNFLDEIKANFFESLCGSLETLNVSACGINQIDGSAFHGLGKLKSLNLSDNQIKDLPSNVFDSLVALQHLDLSKNQISIIPIDLYTKLVFLVDLDMSQNRIERISLQIFSETVNLLHIYMSFNRISVIEKGTKTHFEHFKILDLSKNRCVDRKFKIVYAMNVEFMLEKLLYPFCVEGGGACVENRTRVNYWIFYGGLIVISILCAGLTIVAFGKMRSSK